MVKALHWRHNGRDSVSNHQPHDCLLSRLFRRKSKKTSQLRVTGLCVGDSPGTGEFPGQMASNAENVSIWWRHHGYPNSQNSYLMTRPKVGDFNVLLMTPSSSLFAVYAISDCVVPWQDLSVLYRDDARISTKTACYNQDHILSCLLSLTIWPYTVRARKQVVGVMSNFDRIPVDLPWCRLPHLQLDKMPAISQMIYSDAFSWMKKFVSCLNCHWSLFLRVQLKMNQHWFR